MSSFRFVIERNTFDGPHTRVFRNGWEIEDVRAVTYSGDYVDITYFSPDRPDDRFPVTELVYEDLR